MALSDPGGSLVDAGWLAEHLPDPNLVVVDMRWREDGSGRALYEQGHIPGAMFLDWATDLVDPQHEVAFMLAPPDRFAAAMEGCGIGDETTVVAYADQFGSGPFRLWWSCRVYGHDDVLVLDGGLDRWRSEGRPLSAATPRPRAEANWTPDPSADRGLVARAEDVAAAASRADAVVLDSRPAPQFRGEAVWFETGPVPADAAGIAHTPRGDLRAGHVPWARSVPIRALYQDDRKMKTPEELRGMFAGVGATPEKEAIAYCGVGISAAALVFALRRAGIARSALYDASWEEWGRASGRPVARSDPPAG